MHNQNHKVMRKLFLPLALIALSLGSCKKENVEPTIVNSCSTDVFHTKLIGTYQEVQENVSGTWNTESNGPTFQVLTNRIEYEQGDFWGGDYFIVNDSTFFLRNQNMKCVVRFELSTILFRFDDGKQFRCIRK